MRFPHFMGGNHLWAILCLTSFGKTRNTGIDLSPIVGHKMLKIFMKLDVRCHDNNLNHIFGKESPSNSFPHFIGENNQWGGTLFLQSSFCWKRENNCKAPPCDDFWCRLCYISLLSRRTYRNPNIFMLYDCWAWKTDIHSTLLCLWVAKPEFI